MSLYNSVDTSLRLRDKYNSISDNYHNSILDSILWYSFPIVYGYNESKIFYTRFNKFNRAKKRIRKYMREMFNSYNYFYLITFTFSDDYISSKYTTKKQYIVNFLSLLADDYICCVDFGEENGRIHFHCIVACSPIRISFDGLHFNIDSFHCSADWKYGFLNIKPIKHFSNDMYKSLNYLISTLNYTVKSGSWDYKWFHKRNTTHMKILYSDSSLFGCC